jgi:3-methyladenine DNA glycosylase Mpg
MSKGLLPVREPLVPGSFEIKTTPRIGIAQCADLPLRFIIAGNPFVSRAPARMP